MMTVDVFNVVLSIFLSVLFTAFFIPQVLIVSFRKKLFDYADERRCILVLYRVWAVLLLCRQSL